MDKLKLTLMHISNASSSTISFEASPQITADDLILSLVKRNFIPQPYDYRITTKRLQRVILPGETFQNAGIKDGDFLILESAYESGKTYNFSDTKLDTFDENAEINIIKDNHELAFDKASYRNWWHSILRNFGKYPCYGIFLLLPSDNDLLNYLLVHGNELNIISTNCLVIAPSPYKVKNPNFQLDIWRASVRAYVHDGYGRVFSNLFNIPISSYPNFVVFNDFQSADYAQISLQNMNMQEISTKLRTIFSIIDKAAILKEKPVNLIEKTALKNKINSIGIHMITDVKSLTKTTFEVLIESLIKSSIP